MKNTFPGSTEQPHKPIPAGMKKVFSIVGVILFVLLITFYTNSEATLKLTNKDIAALIVLMGIIIMSSLVEVHKTLKQINDKLDLLSKKN